MLTHQRAFSIVGNMHIGRCAESAKVFRYLMENFDYGGDLELDFKWI